MYFVKLIQKDQSSKEQTLSVFERGTHVDQDVEMQELYEVYRCGGEIKNYIATAFKKI